MTATELEITTLQAACMSAQLEIDTLLPQGSTPALVDCIVTCKIEEGQGSGSSIALCVGSKSTSASMAGSTAESGSMAGSGLMAGSMAGSGLGSMAGSGLGSTVGSGSTAGSGSGSTAGSGSGSTAGSTSRFGSTSRSRFGSGSTLGLRFIKGSTLIVAEGVGKRADNMGTVNPVDGINMIKNIDIDYKNDEGKDDTTNNSDNIIMNIKNDTKKEILSDGDNRNINASFDNDDDYDIISSDYHTDKLNALKMFKNNNDNSEHNNNDNYGNDISDDSSNSDGINYNNNNRDNDNDNEKIKNDNNNSDIICNRNRIDIIPTSTPINKKEISFINMYEIKDLNRTVTVSGIVSNIENLTHPKGDYNSI